MKEKVASFLYEIHKWNLLDKPLSVMRKCKKNQKKKTSSSADTVRRLNSERVRTSRTNEAVQKAR